MENDIELLYFGMEDNPIHMYCPTKFLGSLLSIVNYPFCKESSWLGVWFAIDFPLSHLPLDGKFQHTLLLRLLGELVGSGNGCAHDPVPLPAIELGSPLEAR